MTSENNMTVQQATSAILALFGFDNPDDTVVCATRPYYERGIRPILWQLVLNSKGGEVVSCANWIKCAEFQTLLDVNNQGVSAEQIATLCVECPKRVPVKHWAVPDPCPVCGDLHRGRCPDPPSSGR